MFGPGQLSNPNGPGVSEEGGGTIWVEGISDRQMMAVGRPMIFPATSCSKVLLGWSGRHHQQQREPWIAHHARAETLCVVEGGLEGPRRPTHPVPRVKPTIRPQPLKSLVGAGGAVVRVVTCIVACALRWVPAGQWV